MDKDDGQRYNIGSFSLDSTAKGRHAANELITKTEKIIIKDGITTINSAAFASFQSLTKITIPNSVKKIGDFALKDCKRLQQITIPAVQTAILWKIIQIIPDQALFKIAKA